MKKEEKLVLVALTLFLCGFVCEVLAVYPILSNTLFNADLPNVLGSGYAMIISEIGMALVFVALLLAIVSVALSQKQSWYLSFFVLVFSFGLCSGPLSTSRALT